MKSVIKDVNDAVAMGRQVVAEAGLEVMHGEEPTDHQVRLAALHAREDAAAIMGLLGKVLQRQERMQRWVYVIVVLLVVLAAR